jgi:hypothetical protein
MSVKDILDNFDLKRDPKTGVAPLFTLSVDKTEAMDYFLKKQGLKYIDLTSNK